MLFLDLKCTAQARGRLIREYIRFQVNWISHQNKRLKVLKNGPHDWRHEFLRLLMLIHKRKFSILWVAGRHSNSTMKDFDSKLLIWQNIFACFYFYLSPNLMLWKWQNSLGKLISWWWFGFRLEPIFTTAPAALKNDAQFYNGQIQLENNHPDL